MAKSGFMILARFYSGSFALTFSNLVSIRRLLTNRKHKLTCRVGAVVAIVWDYAVTNFANVAALAQSPWMYASLPIFNTLYVRDKPS